MNNYSIIAQIIVTISIIIVWVFRYHNVVIEFKQFKLNELTRNIVGSTKIASSTLLIVGIWYNELIFIPALILAFLMLSAQYFHYKYNSSLIKRLPSLLLLILCLYIAYIAANNIK